MLRLASFVLAPVLLALCSSAWAQGYAVAPSFGLAEKRPPIATRIDVDSVRPDHATAVVALPFRVRLYGVPCTTLVVSAHGWVRPEDDASAGGPAPPAGPAGARTFPFPPADAADGLVAPLGSEFTSVADGSPGAGSVHTWAVGEAPARRFVVSWENVVVGGGAHLTIQVHLHEGPGRVAFAYATPAITGGSSSKASYVCGIDERGGARFTSPIPGGRAEAGVPGSDFVFEPRTVSLDSSGSGRGGAAVTWLEDRRQSVSAAGGKRPACYVAKGTQYFHVADRAIRYRDESRAPRERRAREAELLAEDRATFGGERGDAARWIRQVLDGKAVLVPKDGGANVRIWFRVVEFCTVDAWGSTTADLHTWNLRAMLGAAFEAGDSRGDIDAYCAWRGMASSRLTVGKLFDSHQLDDAGRQFDSNRRNEYVLGSARIKHGVRGAMPPHEGPGAGWSRLRLRDEHTDAESVQHEDARDLRFVADPSYVDGAYDYVIRCDGNDLGWNSCGTAPASALTNEEFEFGAGR